MSAAASHHPLSQGPMLALATILAIASVPAAAQTQPTSGAATVQPGPAEPWRDLAATDEEAGAAVRGQYPYTADQFRRGLEVGRAHQRAAAFARPVPPNVVRSIRIGLDAGSPVPVIRAVQGYSTAVVFLDLTGAPWPVRRVLMRKQFQAEGDDGKGAEHVVYIAPSGPFDHGNLSVELDGLDLPLSLAILVDDPEGPPSAADFRIVVRVPRPGPHADPLAFARPGRFRAGDALLGAFGSGAPPPGAIALDLDGGDWRDAAWRYQDRVYLKTPRPLLAPGPLAFERGPDGDWIFELEDTPRLVLSDNGVPLRIRLVSLAPERTLVLSPDAVTLTDRPAGGEAPDAATAPPRTVTQ